SGVGIWDAELEATIATGGGRSMTGFLDVDAPATHARIAADPSDPFRAQIPRFDHLLTYGGGPPVVAAYRGWGARACTPIYNGLDPDEHRPLEGVAVEYDLLFMGNRLPDREARVEEFFFRAATLCPEHRFLLGGEGWGWKTDMPANVTSLGHVPTGRHNQVNASARLVLNIHRDSMVQNGWSPATRMFEAAGAASCQVTDAWEGIEDFFAPGEEILVVASAEEVAQLVRSVDDDRARRIGQAGRARALADHTYTQRARQMDAILRAAPVEAA
ncbi:MAG TPA: glycosyltransferase, partial [Longimicrobium sp.]|nr:glycosyltransferase [Longimicrobium sp.]